MEVYEALEKSLDQCISNNDLLMPQSFTSLFYSNESQHALDEFSWDLALLFLAHLTNHPNLPDTITLALQQANLHLSRTRGNPKELLLVYLENGVEYFGRNDATLIHFFDIIESILVRTTPKFILNSLDLVVKFVERRRTNSSTARARVGRNDTRFIDFIEALVNANRLNANNRSSELDRLLTILLINYLARFADGDDDDDGNDGKAKNDEYEPILNICSLIKRLNCNPFQLVLDLESSRPTMTTKKTKTAETIGEIDNENDDDDDDEDEDEEISKISLNKTALSLYTCFLVSPKQYISIPCVYDKLYIFHTLLIHLNRLLNSLDQFNLQQTALTALTHLLTRQDPLHWQAQVALELDTIPECIELLFKLSVYSQNEHIRRICSSNLNQLFSKFDRHARFELLKMFLNRHNLHNNHQTGTNFILAYLIYLVKEELSESFKCNDHFYASNNFGVLFALIFNAGRECGAAGKLVEEAARVIAELNLVRFVLLVDKANTSRVCELVRSSGYLERVEVRARDARNMYELELRDLRKQPSEQVQSNNKEFKAMTVGNEEIREPSREDHVTATMTALRTIDMIDCLRLRVDEILSQSSQDRL